MYRPDISYNHTSWLGVKHQLTYLLLCCSYSPCCVVWVWKRGKVPVLQLQSLLCVWKGAEEMESSCAAATVPVVCVCVYVEGCGREGKFLCCSYSPCCVVFQRRSGSPPCMVLLPDLQTAVSFHLTVFTPLRMVVLSADDLITNPLSLSSSAFRSVKAADHSYWELILRWPIAVSVLKSKN